MQIVTTNLARLTALTPIEDLNPGGRVSIFAIIKGLVDRYHFAKFPKTFEEWDETKGVEFIYGRWEQTEILKLSLFAAGLVIDTRTSTTECDAILEDLYSWATSSLGLAAARQFGTERRWYLSQLTFISDFVLDTIHPALKELADGVTKAVSESASVAEDDSPRNGREGAAQISERRVGPHILRDAAPALAVPFVDEYADPDPFASIEEWNRLHHRDLAAMDLDQLDAERLKAAMRASYAPSSITPWLRERRLKLDAYAERLRRAR